MKYEVEAVTFGYRTPDLQVLIREDQVIEIRPVRNGLVVMETIPLTLSNLPHVIEAVDRLKEHIVRKIDENTQGKEEPTNEE